MKPAASPNGGARRDPPCAERGGRSESSGAPPVNPHDLTIPLSWATIVTHYKPDLVNMTATPKRGRRFE